MPSQIQPLAVELVFDPFFGQHQPANLGALSVGANEQVEGVLGSIRESHPHLLAALELLKVRDVDAEDIFGPILGRIMQDVAEIAARMISNSDASRSAPPCRSCWRRCSHPLPCAADDLHAGFVNDAGSDGGFDAHLAHHGHPLCANVNLLTRWRGARLCVQSW